MFNRIIKPEIRIIAFDDVHFEKQHKGFVTVVGPVFRGGKYLDGMLSTKIEKDGTDATDKLIKTIKKSRNYDQLGIIMLNGITFGGFNVVDIKKLAQKTKLPVIVVQRRKPDIKKFWATMKIFSNYKERLRAAKAAGNLNIYHLASRFQHPIEIASCAKTEGFRHPEELSVLRGLRSVKILHKKKEIYYQYSGISEKDVEKILEMTCIRSDVPEPLRVAHIIASGLSGENRGRA